MARQTAMKTTKAIPEIGDLVRVRQRHWVVTAVRPSDALSSASQDTDFSEDPQNLVELISIDEDARAETLSVVWEIEPDASVENPKLPDLRRFDDYATFENFLNAVRWGAVSNINDKLIQSPYRSGITIEDYQLDPVVRAVNMANVSLMIADDVGLGKTVEAGLVVQEMLLRYRARTVLIVCPASLQLKWQEEMRAKFGLDFRIVNTAYMRKIRRTRGVRANPWTSYPRLITSMDWAKSGDGLELMREVLPKAVTYPRKFDILIVDEAHNVAPQNGSVNSNRSRFIRLISPHFAHHIFLTATPHNGSPESWRALLELLDNQRFSRYGEPDPEQLAGVLVRRLKSEILDNEGKPVFPVRVMKDIRVQYTDEERHIYELLQNYMKTRLDALQNSTDAEWKNYEKVALFFVLQTLKKRLFSSPRAFAQTLRAHLHTLEGNKNSEHQSKRKENRQFEMSRLERLVQEAELALEKPELPHSDTVENKDTNTVFNSYETDSDERDDLEDPENAAVVASTAATYSLELSTQERDMLRELRLWAENMMNRADTKLTAIVDWIKRNLIQNGQWTDRRVILFTEYTATLNVLKDILGSVEIAGGTLADRDRLMSIHGRTPEDEREAIKAAFQADPAISSVRILLATDAASEGIDLQNWCADLIHVEIPWNPNVMEQRNGRVDRHGQKSKEVRIWHPVGCEIDKDFKVDTKKAYTLEADAQYLYKTCLKVERIRNDLGSVSDVIADEVKNIMLAGRTTTGYGADERARRQQEVRKRLQVADTVAASSKKLHETLINTQKELHLEPEVIRSAVDTALRLSEKNPLIPYRVPNDESGLDEGKLFMLPPLSGDWGIAYTGINDPYTKKIRPVTFDHEVAKRRGQDVVLLHLNHPLVAMSLHVLREEVWAPKRAGSLNRVAVRAVPEGTLSGLGVLVVSRLIVSGSDGARLHEEITLAGGLMKAGSFAREDTLATLNEWFEAGSPLLASDLTSRIEEVIKERFEKFRSNLERAVKSRGEERRRSLLRRFDERKKSEEEKIEKTLGALESQLQKLLTGSTIGENEQGFTASMFDAQQLVEGLSELDKKELTSRLNAIPDAFLKEKELIAIRYHVEEDDVRNIPVGMIFLIPETWLAA